MKTVTNNYKNELKKMGKELDNIISYNLNGQSITLNNELISNINYHYEGNILKSVMKQLDFETFNEIPKDTEVNYRFGIKVGNSYEYINYGTFIVKEVEKLEDTDTYKITCYDKMLYSMVDYEDMNLTYPITIKNYLQAICTKLGLTLKDDTFANQDNEIENELYLDSEGNSLGYTFRDVLDEIAQATGSTICINDNDELEVRYIDDAINETQEVEGTDLTLTDSEEGQIRGVSLKGDTYQYTTTGKNLLNPTEITNTTISGITFTIVNDSNGNLDYINVNGTATALVLYQVRNTITLSTGTYTLSGCPSGGSATTFDMRLDGSGSIKDNGKGATFTISQDTTYTNTRIIIRNGYTANNLHFKPMLNTGSTAQQYEPYTNGASPNPDYPQSINVVSGLQEVGIVGKNYINSKTLNSSCSAGGSINLNQTDDYLGVNGLVRVEPNTTYTITFYDYKDLTPIPTLWLGTYDKNKTFIARISKANTRTFTTDSNTYYIFPYIYSSTVDFTTINGNVQLEKGTQSTSFEEYKEQNYDINLGVENLFDYIKISSVNNGTNDNGVITSTTNQSAGIKNLVIKYTNGSITIPANTTIYFSADIKLNSNSTGGFGAINDNVNFTTKVVYPTMSTTYQRYQTTITYTSATTINAMLIQIRDLVGSVEVSNIMISMGKSISFTPYGTTPIELCKIGTYQDKIFKGKGVNLFNPNDLLIGYNLIGTGGETYVASDRNTLDYTQLESNGTYTISGIVLKNVCFYTDSKTFISNTQNTTFTMPQNAKYVRISFDNTQSFSQAQLEKGSQTTYEPYNAKDKWLLHKEIGKYIANNDLTSNGTTETSVNLLTPILNVDKSATASYLSVRTKCNVMATRLTSATNNTGLNGTTSSGHIRVNISKDYASDYATARTFLTNKGLTIYYVMSIPTTEEITNSELVSQLNALDKAHTLEGITNITSTFPLSLTYVSDIEEIDEELIKNTRASFDNVYSPINSLVLSRSADSDNIYIQDEASIEENGLHELKIADNQILNGNNRDEYINEIFEKVNGLTYSYNDFESIGITYLELCDRYKVKVRDNTYKCVMFNDEIEVNNGLNEIIYTDEAEESKTDYTKADKTDRRINQTTLIVDKQQGQINSLVEKVVDVSSTANGIGSITLENAHEGNLHYLSIKGNISRLYPANNVYPENNLYPIGPTLLIDNVEYTLDIDRLRYVNNTLCDEFVYKDGECYIIRRLNSSNQALANEVIEERESIILQVNSSSTISLKHFNSAILSCEYLLENVYTDNFASQVDVKSEIIQTENSITQKVSAVADDEGNVTSGSIMLAINKDESQATIQADKISLEGYTTINDGFSVDLEGNMTCNDASFNGGDINLISGTEQNPTFKITGNNNDTRITSNLIKLTNGSSVYINAEPSGNFGMALLDENGNNGIYPQTNANISCQNGYSTGFDFTYRESDATDNSVYAWVSSSSTYLAVSNGSTMTRITPTGVVPPSKENLKKNFEKLENALEIVKDTDIYKYNFKDDAENTKKHIGFVIGDNYRYRKEITDLNNDGVELYSMISVLWRAVQEQQEEIKLLKNKYCYADMVIMRNYLLGKIDLSETDIKQHYDLNGDGVVDSADLVLLRKILLKGDEK